jgi:hypothetical protein
MTKFEHSPKLASQIERFSSHFFVFWATGFGALVVLLIAAKLQITWLIWIAIATFLLSCLAAVLLWFISAFRVAREWLTGPSED